MMTSTDFPIISMARQLQFPSLPASTTSGIPKSPVSSPLSSLIVLASLSIFDSLTRRCSILTATTVLLCLCWARQTSQKGLFAILSVSQQCLANTLPSITPFIQLQPESIWPAVVEKAWEGWQFQALCIAQFSIRKQQTSDINDQCIQRFNQKSLVYSVQTKSLLFMSSSELSPKVKASERTGRWTKEECKLFEQLIQDYGKDWKRIHSYLPQRSLAQIRSHGQKFFAKTGSTKLKELQRKAKLLAAMEILKTDNMQEEFDRLRKEIPNFQQQVSPVSPVTPRNSPEVKSEDIFEEEPEIKQELRAHGEHREYDEVDIPSKTASVHFPFQDSSQESLAKMQFPLSEDMSDAKLGFDQGDFTNRLPPQ